MEALGLLRKSSFSEPAIVRYQINNDPIDITYRGNPHTSQTEIYVDKSYQKIRLSPIKKDFEREREVYLSTVTLSENIGKRVRIRSVFEENESNWLEYTEREIKTPQESTLHIRLRGIGEDWIVRRGRYNYSNLLSTELDLFNSLYDVLDLALMATDQVEFAYDFLLKDLLLLDLEDIEPGIIKLLPVEEIRDYSLEDLISHIKTVSIGAADDLLMTYKEASTNLSKGSSKAIEDYFKMKIRNLSDLVKLYGVDDDYFSVTITEGLSEAFEYELLDLYNKIKELAIPTQFHSEKEGDHHLSVGDLAKIRVRDGGWAESYYFPLLEDEFKIYMQDAAEIVGEMMNFERFDYSLVEDFEKKFNTLLDEVILGIIAKEDFLQEFFFEREDVAKIYMPVKDMVTITMLDSDVETTLVTLYDRLLKLIEEEFNRFDITFKPVDKIISLTKAVINTLIEKDIFESVEWYAEDKASIQKRSEFEETEDVCLKLKDLALKERGYSFTHMEIKLAELKEEIIIDHTLDNLFKEDVHLIKEDAALNQVGLKEQIGEIVNPIVNEEIDRSSREYLDILEDLQVKIVARGKARGQIKLHKREKFRAVRKQAPNRTVKPFKWDTFATPMIPFSEEYWYSYHIEDSYRLGERLIEYMGYTSSDTGTLAPLGVFVLGKDRLGYYEREGDFLDEVARKYDSKD